MSISSMTVANKTKYKIVLLGDQCTGKTSIIQRFINDKFQQNYNSTIGIDFLVKNICRQSKSYRLQLWDTAGQQRFKSLIPSYLKDSNCAIIVYDVNNDQSFQNIQKWVQLYQEHKDNSAFCVIVGNKIDIQNPSVKYESSQNKAKQLNLKHFNVSAKTKLGIDQLFLTLIDFINQTLKKNDKIDSKQINQKKIQENDSQHTSQGVNINKENIKLKEKKKNDQNYKRCC